jgi:hypothetical protein
LSAGTIGLLMGVVELLDGVADALVEGAVLAVVAAG